MIVVTNRIKVKKGMGAVMAPSFTEPGSETANHESPILGSEIITFEVASVING